MINPSSPEHWLNCLVDRGMFSDEVAVTYPAEGEALHSVFVPVSAVRGLPGEKGTVRVKLFRETNQLFAELPSPQREIVAISERDVADQP